MYLAVATTATTCVMSDELTTLTDIDVSHKLNAGNVDAVALNYH